ncbi:MAG: KpsF/GutQ family sugar-phosphate isomerase [Legionellales bacterium]|nr:KpsF/GutQ family sugar-phosphate isomerase [Legionellales bacterium]
MAQVIASKTQHRFRELGLAVIRTELDAVNKLLERVGNAFEQACEFLLQCRGRVVVTGMGKSGHIANKLAATLASTGTPAFYVHPGEACHGDFGMITSNDVVVALSNSGRTPEIITLLPLIKRLNIPLISLIGDLNSPLAEASTISLDVSVDKEACPLGLAPTSSTTTALVMGDALAIALLEARGFTEKDFAFSHPGGTLGKRLLLHASDVMRTGDKIPRVKTQTILSQALVEISQKGLGMTSVVDNGNRLLGVYTDGDLRRSMDKGVDVHTITIDTCMSRHPKTIRSNMLAIDAFNIMKEHKITALMVTDEEQRVVGVLHIHDLLHAGVM